jgi:hypothetical protein
LTRRFLTNRSTMRCSFWLSDWVCARQGERVFGQPACVAQLPGVLDSRTRPATAITEPRVRRAPRSFLLILLLGSPGLIIDGMRSVVVAALTKLARPAHVHSDRLAAGAPAAAQAVHHSLPPRMRSAISTARFSPYVMIIIFARGSQPRMNADKHIELANVFRWRGGRFTMRRLVSRRATPASSCAKYAM